MLKEGMLWCEMPFGDVAHSEEPELSSMNGMANRVFVKLGFGKLQVADQRIKSFCGTCEGPIYKTFMGGAARSVDCLCLVSKQEGTSGLRSYTPTCHIRHPHFGSFAIAAMPRV